MEKFKACFNRELACLHKEVCEFIVRQGLSVNCHKRNSNFYKQSMNRQESKGTSGIHCGMGELISSGRQIPGDSPVIAPGRQRFCHLPKQGFRVLPEVPWGVPSPLSGKVRGSSYSPVGIPDVPGHLQCLYSHPWLNWAPKDASEMLGILIRSEWKA